MRFREKSRGIAIPELEPFMPFGLLRSVGGGGAVGGP